MRKFVYIMAALLVLIGINTRDVEARRDVYATTYHGNSWYVDQDSVKRVGDILNFTVYTTAGLSYKVTSSNDDYYNADVFYNNDKLVSDKGQSLWKSPGMMAAMAWRVNNRNNKGSDYRCLFTYIISYISINRFLLIRLYVRHIIDLG